MSVLVVSTNRSHVSSSITVPLWSELSQSHSCITSTPSTISSNEFKVTVHFPLIDSYWNSIHPPQAE
ncbi:unnamed protein product [Periconia digitata]|uniref:Uncharacterized protein n=1 Tax=Periconia digitata TaxID=1303443 RepID=A0A9W4XCS7_9PLEO|nr:unnamed protein product [Periconia digitata]